MRIYAEMELKMKENITKNRKWVIKAAVVFFTVLLLLTFFSNTIMNYSLPQVVTQYIQSGPIASKVRGTGVVAADNPYNVTVNVERKVRLVAVKRGRYCRGRSSSCNV